MRRDMSKVIVERPREGSHWKTWRRKGRYDPKRIDLDAEGDDLARGRSAYRRSVSSARHAKWLNENLAPLRRYLLSQVGRPWDDVWSEVCENLKPTSTVQQHVRDHVEDFVALKTYLKDGRIYFASRRYGPRPLDDAKWLRPRAYVDPASGILCANPYFEGYDRSIRRQKAAVEAERSARLRALPDPAKRLLLLDDGNWWEVTLEKAWDVSRRRPPGSGEPLDVVESAGLSTLDREQRYGHPGLVAVAKRPLSKRELKHYGLRDV